jgi:hypothetical protein
MRVLLVVLSIVVAASTCFAQGEILDKGQSAVFVQGGIFKAEDMTAGGGSVGYSFHGLIDLGVSMMSTSYSYGGWYHSYSVSTWSHSLFANEHIALTSAASSTTFLLSLHQAFSWLSKDAVKLPGGESFETINLGAFGTLKAVSGPASRVLLSVGYVQGISIEGYSSSGMLEISSTVASFTSGQHWIGITPSVDITEDQTTVGLTLSLLTLPGGTAEF